MSRKIVLAALLCTASVLFAQESPPPLTVVVGAGSVTAPTYPGSDEYRSLPLPLIDLSYRAGNVVLFASTPEGLGLKVSAPAGFYLKGFAGIGSLVYAESALGDAAESENWATGNVELGWSARGWTLSAKGRWVPTLVRYDGADDEFYHGSILTLSAGKSSMLAGRFIVSGALNLQLMDQDYADAVFSVPFDSGKLDEYRAGPGLSEASCSAAVVYLHDRHVSFTVFGEFSALLGDARSSPVSEADYAGKFGFISAYRF